MQSNTIKEWVMRTINPLLFFSRNQQKMLKEISLTFLARCCGKFCFSLLLRSKGVRSSTILHEINISEGHVNFGNFTVAKGNDYFFKDKLLVSLNYG